MKQYNSNNNDNNNISKRPKYGYQIEPKTVETYEFLRTDDPDQPLSEGY